MDETKSKCVLEIIFHDGMKMESTTLVKNMTPTYNEIILQFANDLTINIPVGAPPNMMGMITNFLRQQANCKKIVIDFTKGITELFQFYV